MRFSASGDACSGAESRVQGEIDPQDHTWRLQECAPGSVLAPCPSLALLAELGWRCPSCFAHTSGSAAVPGPCSGPFLAVV